jgi:phosphoesterase RecJ-like protein
MNIIEQIGNFIKNRDNFLLTAHVFADGDAIGATLACSKLLEKLGKNYIILFDDKHVNQKYSFLANYDKIKNCDEVSDTSIIKSAITLDVPNRSRIGKPANFLPPQENIIKIDHHPPEEEFGFINWVDTTYSSTSEMVYHVIKECKVDIDLDMAKQIYSGLVFDTGRFAFSNTTSRVFRIASEMVETGLDPAEISNAIYFSNTYNAVKLLGSSLDILETFFNGKVGVISIDNQKIGYARNEDTEDIVNYALSVDGVEVALFIREYEPNKCKVSLRSKHDFNVCEVAKKFGGGGHIKASGCRIDGTAQSVKTLLLHELKESFT